MGYLKHAPHGFEMDREGKDSWKISQTGCEAVGVVNKNKFTLSLTLAEELSVEELLQKFYSSKDLVIVEGYKDSTLPKLEVFRSPVSTTLFEDVSGRIAIVSNSLHSKELPVFGLADLQSIAAFIITHLNLNEGVEIAKHRD